MEIPYSKWDAMFSLIKRLTSSGVDVKISLKRLPKRYRSGSYIVTISPSIPFDEVLKELRSGKARRVIVIGREDSEIGVFIERNYDLSAGGTHGKRLSLEELVALERSLNITIKFTRTKKKGSEEQLLEDGFH